jgi:hypothetical protein
VALWTSDVMIPLPLRNGMHGRCYAFNQYTSTSQLVVCSETTIEDTSILIAVPINTDVGESRIGPDSMPVKRKPCGLS